MVGRILYARAGERVYGTRTKTKRVFQHGEYTTATTFEDYHHCTVRHDLYLGELPDFPAPLYDFQQVHPPVSRHFWTEFENVYTTHGTATATSTQTHTRFADLHDHGGGSPPQFGVPWSGETWWRPYRHEVGGTRASVHYDLRFRGPGGTCTWRMDQLSTEGK